MLVEYLIRLLDPTHLLFNHYDCFIATTSWSAPVPCISTLILVGSPLGFLLNITTTGSRSSTEKPELGSRHLYVGHHLPRTQITGKFIPKIKRVFGFDVT